MQPISDPSTAVEHPRTASCRPRIQSNGEVLARLEQLAVDAQRAGDAVGSLQLTRTAALWAWFHHGGRFVSPVLEELLRQAATQLRAGHDGRRPGARPHVLHVLTEAYELGGHTRLVGRWMEADDGSRHSVALTERAVVPEHLGQAVQRAGGAVHVVAGRDALQRAQALLRLARQHDLVVLHVHPHDVVAVVAVEALVQQPARTRPAVLLLNHADHVFWLGTRAVDAVANLRPSSDGLCERRRGIARDRCTRVSIPLSTPSRRTSREEAKRRLGLDPDTTLLLTIASGYKYAAQQDTHFTELVLPVLQQHQDAVLLAVGPSPDWPEWQRAARETGGRVRALGYLTDLRGLHEAADVYLDSYPCPSLTSLLESCTYGVPALSYTPLESVLGPLTTDDDAAGAHLLAASTPEQYRAVLTGLLDDTSARQSAGERTATAVRAGHVGEGWRAQLLAARATAERMRDARDVEAPPATPLDGLGALDDALVLLHDSGAGVQDARTFLREHGGAALECAVTHGQSRRGVPLSIVLAVDGEGGVEATLDALHRIVEHCLPAATGIQTVVVDNASCDGTSDLLHALRADVTAVVLDEPTSPAQVWEAGLAAATSELVLLLSSDVLTGPEVLPAMVRRLATSPPGAAVSAVDMTTGTSFTGARPRTLSSTCLLGRRAELSSRAALSIVVETSAAVRRSAAALV